MRNITRIKRKMVTKIFCDICKKEIQGFGNITELKLTTNLISSETATREEICKECSNKIKLFLDSIRVKW